MRNACISCLLLLTLTARAEPENCAERLYRKVANSAFVNEVRESKGLRLILKDSPPFRIPKFSPGKAVYHHTVRRPFQYATQRLLGKPLEPALLLTLPVAATVSILAFSQMDNYYREALYKHNLEVALQNADVYDELLKTDFRFHEVQKKFREGKITHDQALLQASAVNLAYSNYYAYREKNPGPAKTVREETPYLRHYLFAHLQRVVETGVHQYPGYLTPNDVAGKMISDDQKLHLFAINHVLYKKYKVIAELAASSPLYHATENDPATNELVESIKSDPFAARLIQLNRVGKIDSSTLRYVLQEDAFWQCRFEEWKTIGVTKLGYDPNGNLTATPLTLEQVRDENLRALNLN